MANRLRAIVFDFDGTLADSYAAIAASVNHVRQSRNLPALPEPEIRRHVGRGPAHLLSQTVPSCILETDLALYKAHHPSVLKSGTRLYPGVVETLRILHGAGLCLGVCSNKLRGFTETLLTHLGLAAYVTAVVGPEDAPRLKPFPDMLLTCLEKLGVEPAEALYVGDMVVDIETARAAGVTVWCVTTGTDPRSTIESAGPDRVLENFEQLRELLG